MSSSEIEMVLSRWGNDDQELQKGTEFSGATQ